MTVPSDIIEHLLRRTEYVARSARVSQLIAKPDLAAAVDDILAVPLDPGSAHLVAPSNWERSEEFIHYWLNRMAHDSPRPIQEKISFFWHGHFCSDLAKVETTELLQQQIDVFRQMGMGSVRVLAKRMSTQVAMLRYLDNNLNRKTSPNQNFGRELMELFMLGVGNYVEADVEASAAAWTGHTDAWETGAYVWRADWHDNSTKTYLGRTINLDKSAEGQKFHGYEAIDVMLTNGIVPAGATNVANRGRETRAVAAEFLSRKLWTFFAGSTPSDTVVGALRDVALANDFNITPWVRALLLRSEFYEPAARQGLVRSPVDLMVSLLVHSGMRSELASPTWFLEGMGQRPLSPPNVSGWKHNGYFVNASAMAQRTQTALHFFWRLMRTYWDETGPDAGIIHLPNGNVYRAQVTAGPDSVSKAHQLVDDLLALTNITPTAISRSALYAYAENVNRWDRITVLMLIFVMPDLHVA